MRARFQTSGRVFILAEEEEVRKREDDGYRGKRKGIQRLGHREKEFITRAEKENMSFKVVVDGK